MIPQEDEDKAELDLLLEGIRRRYGYDFTDYSYSSLKRRLVQLRDREGITRYTEMLDRLYHDEALFDKLLKQMSITVTEMFRDPPFYQAVREQVIPVLKTFPFVKIWHAGCATGEEIYSMAILLHEEGFLDRARIYATDYNKHALVTAEQGVYPQDRLDSYAENYQRFGGKGDMSDYFSTAYDRAKIKDFLKENVTFSYHNLVTDGVFGEMNLICCRNVMIYFNRDLQERVLRLFTDSLRHGGFLCLGSKETLKFSSAQQLFETQDDKQRIYKKLRDVEHV